MRASCRLTSGNGGCRQGNPDFLLSSSDPFNGLHSLHMLQRRASDRAGHTEVNPIIQASRLPTCANESGMSPALKTEQAPASRQVGQFFRCIGHDSPNDSRLMRSPCIRCHSGYHEGLKPKQYWIPFPIQRCSERNSHLGPVNQSQQASRDTNGTHPPDPAPQSR